MSVHLANIILFKKEYSDTLNILFKELKGQMI